MAVIANQPRLQKFGANASGSLTPVVLIGPVSVPLSTSGFNNSNVPYMTEFGASVAAGGAGSYFQLQVGPNNSGPWTEIERIEIPNSGVVSLGFGRPIPICAPGQSFQITATQSTAARMAAKLFGICTNADIVDV